jgi:hypothetical protein
VKASELKEPGLYWAIDAHGEHDIAEVASHRNEAGEVTHLDLVWLGIDHAVELPLKNPDYAGLDFIGPFPLPRTGPKFASFLVALEALCRAWGVQLATGGYDTLEVWDAPTSTCEALLCNGVKDRTKPAKG